MDSDINKIKEVLDLINPYLKWIMISIYAAMFLFINKVFIKDSKMKAWLLTSLEETPNRASGKSLTAFVFSQLIALATLAAIIYSPQHLLPEYFLISLLMFIASVYGIKLAGKYFNGGNDNSTTTETSQSSTTQIITSPSTKDVNKEKKVEDENIG